MATTWTVNSLADSGPGTLRAAIAAAVSGDTINFSVSGTITLATQLEIAQSITIDGPGAASLTISGNNASLVFQIDSGATVSISGVTMENGAENPPGLGGGVYNLGTLTVSNCTFSGNGNATASLHTRLGGGIYNTATLVVSNSTFSSNSASDDGGAIYNFGTVTITNSTFSGNSVPGGGGGAIYNDGTATVTASTFSGNSSNGGGAVINGGMLTVTNSTFSGNSSPYFGGGIMNSGTATVTASTFSGNSAPKGGGIYNFFGAAAGTATVKNTLLANSTAGGNCDNDTTNGAAVFTSNGHNLSDDNSCAAYFNQTGDINDPSGGAGLDPAGLQNNGGPTDTIALLATSPAVDAIPVSPTNYCTDANGNPLATDQRGVTRPQGPACDIGAFELAPSVAFSSFKAALIVVAGGPRPGFLLDANFKLGATSSGINPLTEPVTFKVGTYSVTLPAGSFTLLKPSLLFKNGIYSYQGTISGASLGVQIVPLGGNSFQFVAEAAPVTLAPSNPVSVTITIGNDTGTINVQPLRF